ncbi:MAG: hypothetical protein JSS14_05365 [Proteobacteria bacterium]|nr:hypothetical protein [Pseudomonadota bacterium]
MSELTVDFWVAVSVIPMVIALCIYLWLSRRFDRSREHDVRRYEELVQKVQAPLEGPRNGLRHKPRQPPPPPIPPSNPPEGG